jgi:ABC-2 type transport system permease protein
MIATLRRQLKVYGAIAATIPKLFLAYQIWVWMQFVVQTIALIIFVSFWKAVYAGGDTISGLELQQTLNYIILAQIFIPLVHSTGIIYEFGWMIRQGRIGIELLKPVDFQLSIYVQKLTEVGISLVLQLPMAVIGWLLFRYQLPTDPLIWLAFIVTLLLGNALLFCFDWMVACLCFYTTEAWGLGVLRFGVSTFFSGSLVPLVMMPGWLQTLTVILPFSQALYAPVALLSGITALADMPRIWLTQLVSLIILLLLSRLVFRFAARKITVQGG